MIYFAIINICIERKKEIQVLVFLLKKKTNKRKVCMNHSVLLSMLCVEVKHCKWHRLGAYYYTCQLLVHILHKSSEVCQNPNQTHRTLSRVHGSPTLALFKRIFNRCRL
jgi:hypothetical protein